MAPGRKPSAFEKGERRALAAERRAIEAGGESDGDNSYSLMRGLQGSSHHLTATTRFGDIAGRIRYRLDRMRPDERLSILTIGAGRGVMEAEIKALFGDRIEIDTFSLTSEIDPENRGAIRHEHLGNTDYNELPSGDDGEGYHLVISTNATQWAEDQEWAARAIANRLRVGGEATFTIRTRSPLFAQIEALHRDGTIMDFGGLLLCSGRLVDNLISQVYMERTSGKQFDFGAFLTAPPVEGADATLYQFTRGGEWHLAQTKNEFRQEMSEVVEDVLAYLKTEEIELTRLRRGWFLKNVFTDVRYAKLPIDEAVKAAVDNPIICGALAFRHGDGETHRRRIIETATRRAATRRVAARHLPRVGVMRAARVVA